MNIAVTGYHGTGSSAVVDLLAEYEGCSECGRHSYEHIPLYVPNGLFDLEHKLLLGNDLHRSDEAIKTFRKAMYALNDNHYGWFGAYKHYYGDEFKELVDRFLNKIVQYTCNGEWYYYWEKEQFSIPKFIKDCLKTFIPGKQVFGVFGKTTKVPHKRLLELSFVSEDEFYMYAREFIKDYCAMINTENSQNLILDHLVFPHHSYKIEKFFDDDFRLIIVDRDARDMYTLCKHVWPRMNLFAPYPTEKKAFIELWNRIRMADKGCDSEHILRVHFEDLIYDYDNTVARIEQFTGLKPEQHTAPKSRFDPAKSINNTQNFRIHPEWEDDVADFSELTKDIYPFPYERVADINDTFDS